MDRKRPMSLKTRVQDRVTVSTRQRRRTTAGAGMAKVLVSHSLNCARFLLIVLAGVLLCSNPAGANMIIRGQCFVDGAPAPDGLDVRFKYNASGVYQDFTDKAKSHQTRNGYYEGEALVDSNTTFEKDGYKDNDVVFVFVNGQICMNSSINSTSLSFIFKDLTIQNTPNAYLVNDPPQPVSGFDAQLMPRGRVKLVWDPSTSEDASEYLIFWDNASGTIDYTAPLARVKHPADYYTVPMELTDSALYFFHIKVQDTLGKIEDNRFNVRSAFPDAINPTAAISTPPRNGTVNGNFDVIGTALDSHFKDYILEYGRSLRPSDFSAVGARSFIPINNTRLATFKSDGLADGLYTLKLTVTDTAGNTGIVSVPFLLSKSTPFITYPRGYEIISGSVVFTGTATDPTFSSYRLEYGKGEIPSLWTPFITSTDQVTAGTLGTWDTKGLDGTYTVRLVITRADGSDDLRDKIVVYLENNEPVLTILEPVQNFYTNVAALEIKGKTEPSAAIRINGSTVEIPSNTETFTSTVALVEGQNDFTITAADSSGNVTNSILTVFLDTVPPSLTILSPIDNFATTRPIVTARGVTETDAVLLINGGAVVIAGDGSFSTTVVLGDSQNSLDFMVTDRAGNVTRTSRIVVVSKPVEDNLPPEISLFSPGLGTRITSYSPEIIFMVSDDLSGVNDSMTSFVVDGFPVAATRKKLSQSLYSLTYIPPRLTDGTHEVSLSATDFEGNSSTLSGTFVVDTKPPTMKISLRADETDEGKVNVVAVPVETISGDPVCRAWLVDHTEEFDPASLGYSVPLTFMPATAATAAHYAGTFGVSNYFNGKLVVEISATDLAGQTGTTRQSAAAFLPLATTSFLMDRPGSGSIKFPRETLVVGSRHVFDCVDIITLSTTGAKGAAMTAQGLAEPVIGARAGSTAAQAFKTTTLTLTYPEADNDGFVDGLGEVPAERLAFYRWDQDSSKFVFMPSTLKWLERKVETSIEGPGIYHLLADITPPTISLLTPLTDKESTHPKILYTIADDGSGISDDGITFQLNGLTTTISHDRATGKLAFFPKNPLTPDTTYEVTLSVVDRSGNRSTLMQSFTTRSVLEITQATAWPNPVRTETLTFRYILTRDADDVKILIFDNGGDRIHEIDGDTYGGANDVVWDVRTDSGKRLPNDVYFFKIVAGLDDGQKIEKIGKFAVIR